MGRADSRAATDRAEARMIIPKSDTDTGTDKDTGTDTDRHTQTQTHRQMRRLEATAQYL